MVKLVYQFFTHHYRLPKGKVIDLYAVAKHLKELKYDVGYEEDSTWFLHVKTDGMDLCIPRSGKINLRTMRGFTKPKTIRRKLTDFFEDHLQDYLTEGEVNERKRKKTPNVIDENRK